MDPLADSIAALSLLLSGLAIWLGRRDAKLAAQKREAWELGQEQKQLLLNEPSLVPVGGSLHTTGMPQRLMAAADQSVTLHNEGSSTPSNIRAVFFPSATYIVLGDTLPQKREKALGGVYWEGIPSLTPAPNTRCPIDLKVKTFPLTGELSVIEGISLYAPNEPDIYANLTNPPRFYCARLTFTYQDRARRNLAVAYDLDAATSEWMRIAGPVVVPLDLAKLSDQEEQRRRPHHIS